MIAIKINYTNNLPSIKVNYEDSPVFIKTTVEAVYVKVDYGTIDNSSGGSGTWGSISGTLSNQTDLQNALNAKFDDPAGTSLQYIDGTGALQTFPLTLPTLQEVRNQTGSTLAKGTVVYINGATGNKPTVTKAIATGDATSAQTLGLIQSDILNNGVGYVVVFGTCGNLDTSAYTEGQQLYLSGTVAGGYTAVKQYAPVHMVYIGIVTRSHPTLGTIEVRTMNGFELDELHNVVAQTPSNNDSIFWNSSTSLWESKSTAQIFVTDYDVDITGLRNSSNKLFTLSSNFASGSTKVYVNGLRYTRGSGYDYVENGNNQITFSLAPDSGDLIIVDYIKI